MSEVQSCACGPSAAKPANSQQAKKTNTGSRKLLSWSIGGGLLCVLACAAGPLLVALGITLTATAITTGLGVLAVAAVAVLGFAGIRAIVKRRRATIAKSLLTPRTILVPTRLMSSNPEIACNPAAIDPSRRQEYESAFDAVLQKATETKNTGDQVVMHFKRDVETFAQISNWIRDEQECCPFLTFDIQVQPKDGEIVVQIGKGEEIARNLMELIDHKTANCTQG